MTNKNQWLDLCQSNLNYADCRLQNSHNSSSRINSMKKFHLSLSNFMYENCFMYFDDFVTFVSSHVLKVTFQAMACKYLIRKSQCTNWDILKSPKKIFLFLRFIMNQMGNFKLKKTVVNLLTKHFKCCFFNRLIIFLKKLSWKTWGFFSPYLWLLEMFIVAFLYLFIGKVLLQISLNQK